MLKVWELQLILEGKDPDAVVCIAREDSPEGKDSILTVEDGEITYNLRTTNPVTFKAVVLS